ncbi:hypothetical protein BDR26DRAFT_872162 [Obelidium mucronatum]|nr:hypothetical protein BDR26DRAFT_872162 [Obelidium mucronatum]
MSTRHPLPPPPHLAKARAKPSKPSAQSTSTSMHLPPRPVTSLPPRPTTVASTEHTQKKQKIQSGNPASYANQSTGNNTSRSFNQPGQYRKRSNNQQMSAQKRNFVMTFAGLVNTLRTSFADVSLKSSPYDRMSAENRAKLAKKIGKSSGAFLPIVNERGLLLGQVRSLVEHHIDFKPYWTTRHHSSGGLSSFVAFFPTAFKINKGGGIPLEIQTPSGTTELIHDQDRLAFTSSDNPLLDVSQIYDEYERSGFDTPLAIASDLEFELIPCCLPNGFDIVYGTTNEICDQFVMSEIVDRVDSDGTWIPKPNTFLGFDTETTMEMWTPQDPSLPPNLLQISTPTKCLLVHQSAIKIPLPKSIHWILTHPDIKKVCANAAGEVVDLRKFNLEAQGIEEIADAQVEGSVASGAGTANRRVSTGLSTLAAIYLGLKMKKPKAIQIGNWTRPLNRAQMDYAATDAWVSLLVYQVLATIPQIQKSGEQDENKWWDNETVRRVAVVAGYHDPKWVRLFLEAGMERIPGTGKLGITVFAERASKRVDINVLKEFYENI